MAASPSTLSLSAPARRGVLQSTNEGATLAWLGEQFEQARKNRLQFEKDWYTNLAFYFGKQYVQWTPSFGTTAGNYQRLYEPPAPSWRVRLVSNKIRPIVRAEHAKVCKEEPEPYVVPASTDDEDLAAARAAEHIHEFLWRDLKMKRVVRRMAFWLVVTGNGFIKDWYDPSVPDSSGVPGQLKAEVVTPFHMYVPEMDEEEIEAQPMVHHVVSKTPDYIEATYGVSVEPDSSSGSGVLESKFLQALGINKPAQNDHVAVRESWVKPCSRFEEGAVVSWLEDQILNISETWPWDHGEYPFTKFSHVPTGRFYADSPVIDLIPLQKEYNRTRSQIIESKNKMSKPQLRAVRGSVDPNKITSEPGLIVFYTPGFQPPEPIPLIPIPNYVIQELDRCQSDMDDISSQHETSRGQAPAGVTAATAISYLQEEDDSKLASTIASIEEGVEKLGKHFLEIVQQFWDLERTVRVVGTDGTYESYVFSNADIRGNTDLNIQSGSGMPRSRAAKQAFIMQLGQLGWIPPDRALRYLDMAETGRMYEEMQKDARQAQRENLKMLAGQQCQPNTWDEHQIHVQEHNNERKGQKFEEAPDNVKQLFEQHVQVHQMAMQQNAMQAQAQGQNLMPPNAGQAPPSPAPGPPSPAGPPPVA